MLSSNSNGNSFAKFSLLRCGIIIFLGVDDVWQNTMCITERMDDGKDEYHGVNVTMVNESSIYLWQN